MTLVTLKMYKSPQNDVSVQVWSKLGNGSGIFDVFEVPSW